MRKPVEYTANDGTRTWRVRFRLGKTETSETFRRKTDAEMFCGILGDGRDGRTEEALRWLNAKREDRESMTFGDWHDLYLEQLTGVTPRTREEYRAYRHRYYAAFESMPLPLITRAHVAGMVNHLEREGRKRKTIKNALHHLSSVMAVAIDDGHIVANPCRRVRIPKDELDAYETRFLTPEEVVALLDAVPDQYEPLVTFLVGTGLRWSEATALQCRHVDLDNGTVRVTQAWKQVKGVEGGRVLGPPKSPKSRRTVNAAVSALAAVQPLLGKPNDFLFTTVTGKPLRYSGFYDRVWVPAREAAGVEPPPGLHALRHTFASWLISEGMSLEAVQDQLGHESFLTTRKLYAHLLPAVGVAAGKAASAALDRALGQRVQPPSLEVVRVLEAGRGSDEPTDP